MRKFILVISLVLSMSGCQNVKLSPIDNTNGSVYYEIFVGSFYDSNGDGIGDLNGITMQLDYLSSLGIKGIWITPIHPSLSYHKYDVLDYKTIDPSFGTMADFENLVKEAKNRNIDILMDLVINHTSSEHPWFIEAKKAKMNQLCETNRYCDYYNFTDSKVSQSSRLSSDLYYESVFGEHMPDLNLDNEEVLSEIREISEFWLDKGIQGFRLDAALHYYGDIGKNNKFLSWFNTMVKTKKADAFVVAEVWGDTKTVQGHYQSQLDSFFNFPASFTDGFLVSNIRRQTGHHFAKWLVEYQTTIKAINPNAIDSIFLSNHDQARSSGFFKSDEAKWRLMVNSYLLAPGRPFIYYGEEVGMSGSGIDQNKRLAMPWYKDELNGKTKHPEGYDYQGLETTSVEEQNADPKSLLNHYRHLIEIRNRFTVLEKGAISLVDLSSPSLYAIQHQDDIMSIIVVHNFSNQTQVASLSETIKEVIPIQGSTISFESGQLTIEALASVILILER